MASEMKEGFLCPICMNDLGDVIQLQVHFEEKHSKEDPVFLQNLKDLFGKAKKKILNDEDEGLLGSGSGIMSNISQEIFGASSSYPDHDPVSGIHLTRSDDRFAPRITSHTLMFKEERQKKMERNKSTNQVRNSRNF